MSRASKIASPLKKTCNFLSLVYIFVRDQTMAEKKPLRSDRNFSFICAFRRLRLWVCDYIRFHFKELLQDDEHLIFEWFLAFSTHWPGVWYYLWRWRRDRDRRELIMNGEKELALVEAAANYCAFMISGVELCSHHHSMLLVGFSFNIEPDTSNNVPKFRAETLVRHLGDLMDFANSQLCFDWFEDDLLGSAAGRSI